MDSRPDSTSDNPDLNYNLLIIRAKWISIDNIIRRIQNLHPEIKAHHILQNPQLEDPETHWEEVLKYLELHPSLINTVVVPGRESLNVRLNALQAEMTRASPPPAYSEEWLEDQIANGTLGSAETELKAEEERLKGLANDIFLIRQQLALFVTLYPLKTYTDEDF